MKKEWVLMRFIFAASFFLLFNAAGMAEALDYKIFGQVVENGIESSRIENGYTYVQLDTTGPAYAWGNVRITYNNTDRVECISIEEPYDYWGFWTWWTTATADPLYGGGGALYHYSDGGGEWARQWVDNGYGYGIPGSIDRTSGAIYLYAATYAAYPGWTMPLRLGFRLKEGAFSPVTVTFSIASNAWTNYDWHEANLSPSSSQYQVAIIPEVPSIIPATVVVTPDTLNLKSKGNYVTAYIEIPGYDLSKIDISTILLNGDIPAGKSPASIGDYDGDGIPDLMVKFDRASFANFQTGVFTLKMTGIIGGIPFEGEDSIRIIKK